MRKTTVSFVNISDIYDHLAVTVSEFEWIADRAWSNVSYGDAWYTLIGNNFALDALLEAYESYHRHTIANKSMTAEDFTRKFWEIVGTDDYVNLES